MNRLVADTGPLNYLIQIGAVGFLPALFDGILIPESVLRELRAPGAPPAVREWSRRIPSWCLSRSGIPPLSGKFDGLSPADLDVLALAVETKSPVLLDDLAARNAARSIGLRVIGTLGVLEAASDRNLIFLPDFIEKLRRTNIHLSENLYETILQRHADR